MTLDQTSYSFTRFSIFSSGFELTNMLFYTNVTTHSQNDVLIRYYNDANNSVSIDN
jgi:hypothetical protein